MQGRPGRFSWVGGYFRRTLTAESAPVAYLALPNEKTIGNVEGESAFVGAAAVSPQVECVL